MPKYFVQDQKAIWTSPFHTAKSDIKYWAVFGGAIAGMIAADRHIEHALPTSSTEVSVSTWASRVGSAYSLVPLSAGFYFIGTKAHSDRFRETGLLCFEALIDSNVTVEAVKLVADRARPLQDNGHGGFESGPSRWDSSFPSGHSINTWAMASVIVHQYPHPRWVPILTYALASTVVVSRVGARQHFPGDVLAGSAMGWFIGDFVYGRRHNRELDSKHSATEQLLDHVRLGGAAQ
jgi:membrane-associated phospholipid phosphatase